MGWRISWRLVLAVMGAGGLAGSSGAAEKSEDGAAPGLAASVTNDLIRQVGPGLFEIGRIRLNQEKGTLVFPATVNLREGAIEYVLVADHGKIHESLLRTDVPPYQIQLALVLLGASLRPTNGVAAIGSSSGDRRPRILVDVSWKVRGRTRTEPAGSFVENRRARTRVKQGQWVYNGSRFREGGLAAQADGSIIAVIDDLDAIVGNALPGADDDDSWLAVGKKLPPSDAPVDVTLTLIRSK